MDDLTLDPVAPHRARIGDALIVLGALGLFGGLLLEQPFAMLAGLILLLSGWSSRRANFSVRLRCSGPRLNRGLLRTRAPPLGRASPESSSVSLALSRCL